MRTPRPTKYCRMCLKLFSMYPSQQHQKYCSNACAYAAFHLEGWAKAKPKVIKSCEACGARIETHPSDAIRKRFCSQRCHLKARGEEQTKHNAVKNVLNGIRITCTCKQCGKSFVRRRSEIAAGGGIFCCRQCQGTHFVHQKRPRVSKIEKKFGDMLEHEGLSIQRSYRIGPWVCDFYVPSVNLVIEFDGKYWHSLPAMIKRDERKDEYLTEHGYRISRVTEGSTEYLSGVAKCLSSIHGSLDSSTHERRPIVSIESQPPMTVRAEA